MTRWIDGDEIGDGGFGTVFQCKEEGDRTFSYAKKVLTDPDDNYYADNERFKQEVRILRRLQHPNIVEVKAIRLHKNPLFFVMPLYQTNLRDQLDTILGNESRIKPIFGAILSGLEYAHKENVVHRDLKPANVLMNNDDDVVLCDFGLGIITDSTAKRLTKESRQSLGTPAYEPPEPFKERDQRSDIYSLGLILYELYKGENRPPILDFSGIPVGIRGLIERCTKIEPSQRFQTVSDLSRVWRAITDETEIDSEEQKIQNMAGLLATAKDENLIPQFIALLVKRADNGDLVHESLMTAGASVVAKMDNQDHEKTFMLLELFAKFITSQGWPFDYTDQIGDFCNNLLGLIKDVKLRTLLIGILLEVGVSHHRFKVMTQFKKNVIKQSSATEISYLSTELQKFSKEIVKGGYKIVCTEELLPSLRVAFESAILKVPGTTNIGKEKMWKAMLKELSEQYDEDYAERIAKLDYQLTSHTLIVKSDHSSYAELIESCWNAVNNYKVIVYTKA